MQPSAYILSALEHAVKRPRLALAQKATLNKAAVAAVLRNTPQSPEVLFIQRAEHPNDPWSGHMAFPGGRMEPTDLDERSTAERETDEEIGLRLQEAAHYLGPLDEIQARTRRGPIPLGVSPFVYWLEQPFHTRLSAEVQEIVWIPLLELYSPLNLKSFDYPVDQQMIRLPSIEYRGKIIWGLTLRILVDLLERLEEGPLAPWLRDELGLQPNEKLIPDWRLTYREP